MIVESCFVRKIKFVDASSAKKNLINPIQGHSRSKIQRKSEYCKFKVISLHRDHPPAKAISNSASVGVEEKNKRRYF